MPGTDASVDVSGTAANRIAQSVLDSLGVDPESVDTIDVGLEIDGYEPTSISVDAEGALAGVLVPQMIGAIDWSEVDVEAISAHVTASDEPATTEDPQPEPRADPEPQPAEADGEGERAHQGLEPGGTVGVSGTEGKTFSRAFKGWHEQPEADDPVPVKEGTGAHCVLEALESMGATDEDSAVTAREIVDNDDYYRFFPSKNTVSTVLSEVFREHGLVHRKRDSPESGGIEFHYWINEFGQAELERHPPVEETDRGEERIEKHGE